MPNEPTVSIAWHGVKEFEKSLADTAKRADKAAMWAIRESGRNLGRAARKRVRVYSGNDASVERGLLKKNIHSDKRMTHVGDSWSLKVGPRGPANAYAAKIEAIDPYMRPAYEETVARYREVHANAWARSMKR